MTDPLEPANTLDQSKETSGGNGPQTGGGTPGTSDPNAPVSTPPAPPSTGTSKPPPADLPAQVCGGIAGLKCPDGQYCDLPATTCGKADLTGVCMARPEQCREIYQPVCGCDGKTYGNDCDRARAGVSKARDGACEKDPTPTGKVCGGIAAIKCAPNEYCQMPVGTCGKADLTGQCVARGEICPAIYAPVCGCDGRTYSSDCARGAVGVSKLHDGECRGGSMSVIEVGVGESCGGFRAAPQRICAKGLFCESKPETCGQLVDAPGTCSPVPAFCTREFAPVCGCDDKTYANDCIRRAAGVSLKAKGECKAPTPGTVGSFCGGIAGIACGAGLVCDQQAGACKGADIGGTCKVQTSACTKILAPVCGCDGRTYGNDCMRLAAGVAKDHDGTCQPPTPAPKLLPAGIWGGEQIGITVKDPNVGAAVDIDCATGNINGPLLIDGQGQFKWPGTYTAGTGGPIRSDLPLPRPVHATYYGRIDGGTMLLEIYRDGSSTPLKFKLALGKMPFLVRCL